MSRIEKWERTSLDDPEAVGLNPISAGNQWYDDFAAMDGAMLGVRRHMQSLWLSPADESVGEELVSMYADARMADDPFFLDDYPEREEILRRLTAGEVWALRDRREDALLGACVLTHDPALHLEDDLLHRGKASPAHTPGENWFYPGRYYLTLMYMVVRPPLDPYADLGALHEYALRAAAAMGIYELRTSVNLRNRAVCRVMTGTGSYPVLAFRRPNNEMYVGFIAARPPVGAHQVEFHGYCSPSFEKLTPEEYARLLAELGIDREEYVESRYYRPRDAKSIGEE